MTYEPYEAEIEKKCAECGETYFTTQNEINWFQKKGMQLPKRCKKCRDRRRRERENQNNQF